MSEEENPTAPEEKPTPVAPRRVVAPKPKPVVEKEKKEDKAWTGIVAESAKRTWDD